MKKGIVLATMAAGLLAATVTTTGCAGYGHSKNGMTSTRNGCNGRSGCNGKSSCNGKVKRASCNTVTAKDRAECKTV